MACTVSLSDPCDFFLVSCLKDQIVYELPRSISDLKAENRKAISSITEDKLEIVFRNLGNRLSFVICENEVTLTLG